MARRKRRARRHQNGLESIPEKLLVKIVEARLAGRRARQDPETMPIDWWSINRLWGKVPTDIAQVAETLVRPPLVGTQGRFILVPEAREMKKEWLKTWPEAASFFSGARKSENFHKAGYGIIICTGKTCRVCQESTTSSREVLALTDYAELEVRTLLMAKLEGAGRLKLRKGREG
jgi:hypothetical protein